MQNILSRGQHSSPLHRVQSQKSSNNDDSNNDDNGIRWSKWEKKQNQKLKTKLTGLATTENYELPKNKNKYFKLQSWLI